MHAWKSFFYSLYVITAWGMTLLSLVLITQGQWLWSGVLLAWLPLQLVNLWRRYRAPVFVEDERETLAMAMSLLGLAILLVGGERSWPLALGGLGIACLLVYRFFWSSVKPGLREVKADTSVLAGLASAEQPTLVLFMRGEPCPFSQMVIRDTTAFVEEVAAAKALQLVYLYPQSSIVGATSNWSDALGINLRGGAPWGWRFTGCGKDTLSPAMALLDTQGKCLFWDRASNYRLPPTPRNRWSKIAAQLK
jgi:uncharacterized membrane protein